MSRNQTAEIAIAKADLGEDDCHADLRLGAFLHRMAAYRLLNGRQQPCDTDPGTACVDCPMPARG
jgi:hypothetical protein